MKNKKLITLSIASTIACTGTLSFANEIKIMKKNNIEYIPLEEVIKKAGGTISTTNNKIKVNIDKKVLQIEKNNSFVKVNDIYKPIQTAEVDGFTVPRDTKVISQKEKTYIEKDFLKNQKIVDYKIENNSVVINKKSEPTKTTSNIQPDEDNTQQKEQESSTTRPTRPNKTENSESNNTQRPEKPNKPNKPAKPSRPGNGANNNIQTPQEPESTQKPEQTPPSEPAPPSEPEQTPPSDQPQDGPSESEVITENS